METNLCGLPKNPCYKSGYYAIFSQFFALIALLISLCLGSNLAMAEDVANQAIQGIDAASQVAAASAPSATAAPSTTTAAASAAAPTPEPNKGDTTWMMLSTLLVVLMIVPGLSLFYGGLVRAKNMLSILSQVFTIFALVSVLWVIYGYSLAFGNGGSFNWMIGDLGKMFLSGVTTSSTAATFSAGVVIPEFSFIAFQLTFAAITVALIVGGFAERIKFSALLVFSALWFTFSYIPIAHMVWVAGGYLFDKGDLDFAGGTVVHINAGIAALVGAIVIGKRIGYGKEAMAPHNLPMTMIGASLLWVGWFGFNAGSNLEATGTATLAFLNTLVATAAGTLAWMFCEWAMRGKPSLLGIVSGAVTGLVAVTPAAGLVGPMGAIALGAVAAPICFWAVTGLKRSLGYDDTLDVFGIHAVGGIIGAIGTGIFVSPALGGMGVKDYEMVHQVVTQATGVAITVAWSGIVSFVLFKLVDLTIGLRVSEESEREGLDTTTHGERAYSH